MYSKDEKVKAKQAFWTAFGQYMKGVPVLDEKGKSKNWLNYKSGVNGIVVKTDATDKMAYIGIEILHKNEDERNMAYQQFLSLKKLFDTNVGKDWTWEKDHTDLFGKMRSRIYCILENVNVYRQEDWPSMISFFKPRILSVDAFWEEVKPIFEK